MSDRNGGGQPSAGPSNWLKKLDEQAANLPKATSWLTRYGPFMLARYPNLKPQPVPGNAVSQMRCKSDERTSARQFAEWESRIATNQETVGCLNDLDGEQRRQLAALLIETIDDLEMRTATDRSRQWKRQLRKEALTRSRVLNKKLQKARRSIRELMAYARDSRNENARDSARHKARRMLGEPYVIAAANALQDLDVRHLSYTQKCVEIATEPQSVGSEGVEVFGMVRLYWFFRYGCGLSGDESEVRVALLRNAFWTEYGVSAVTLRANYIVGQSRGCEAVHLAVHRQ